MAITNFELGEDVEYEDVEDVEDGEMEPTSPADNVQTADSNPVVEETTGLEEKESIDADDSEEPEDSDPQPSEDAVLEARRLVSNAALEISRLEGLLKIAKKRQKFLVANLFNFVGDPSSDSESKPDVSPESTSPAAPEAADQSAIDWRAVPSIQLNLNEVKGLGSDKLERLIEACPTLGDLEDLRAGKGIRSLKGFGEALSDRIEQKILDWLTQNRDRDLFQDVPAPTGDCEPEAPVSSEQTDSSDDSETQPTDSENGKTVLQLFDPACI